MISRKCIVSIYVKPPLNKARKEILMPFTWKKRIEKTTRHDNDISDVSFFHCSFTIHISHKYWQCHSWVAVSQTLKFLPLALVRNDIVYSPPARRQCHSLLEQEEEISMSARLPPRNGPLLSLWSLMRFIN